MKNIMPSNSNQILGTKDSVDAFFNDLSKEMDTLEAASSDLLNAAKARIQDHNEKNKK